VDWLLLTAIVLAFAGVLIGMLEDVDRIQRDARGK
jgi:hypothetical protein